MMRLQLEEISRLKYQQKIQTQFEMKASTPPDNFVLEAEFRCLEVQP